MDYGEAFLFVQLTTDGTLDENCRSGNAKCLCLSYTWETEQIDFPNGLSRNYKGKRKINCDFKVLYPK
jgi:hypothetical protein